MQLEDLAMVRGWRNHPDVREVMFSKHEITEQEHAKWFELSCAKRDRHLLIFEVEQIAMGFASFTARAESANEADWGFYVAPGSPPGTGMLLGQTALALAFDSLGFTKVHAKVLLSNAKSLRFHERLGFRSIGDVIPHDDATSPEGVRTFELCRGARVTKQ